MTPDATKRIFENEIPETQFVPGGNASEVTDDKRGIAYALGVLIHGTKVLKLIDRDARSVGEVADLQKRGVRVLSRRNLESYLFDDEVLRVLALSVGREEDAETLLARKNDISGARTNDAPDDLKPASGEIYVACTKVLGLANPRQRREDVHARYACPPHQAGNGRVRRTAKRHLWYRDRTR